MINIKTPKLKNPLTIPILLLILLAVFLLSTTFAQDINITSACFNSTILETNVTNSTDNIVTHEYCANGCKNSACNSMGFWGFGAILALLAVLLLLIKVLYK